MDNLALKKKALQLRKDVARMIGVGKVGHLGGSCSLADIVTMLYYEEMRVDPANPHMPDRDRFLLSKGHAALIQYAALGDLGFFPREEESTLKQLGSRLQGHPDLRKLPGIEANTGSLGQGISMAAGMAAGLRLDHSPARVYCALGDGELAEGQVWEALMSAGVFRLSNLCAIVDLNGLQARAPWQSASTPLRTGKSSKPSAGMWWKSTVTISMKSAPPSRLPVRKPSVPLPFWPTQSRARALPLRKTWWASTTAR